MSNNNINPDTRSMVRGIELSADTLIHGLQTAVPSTVTQLTVSGVVYTIADLVKKTEDLVKPWKDARIARTALRQFSQDRPGAFQKLLAHLADVKIGLASVFGRQNEALTQFGFKPQRRRKPLTSEEKTIRAAKAKLTRERRHTMGRRQKAAIRSTEAPALEIKLEPAPPASTPTNPAPPAPKP